MVSCGNDDSNTTTIDPIIGRWQLYKLYEDGIEADPTPCSPTTEEYINTGNLLIMHYELNANSECIAEQKNNEWLRVSENKYRMLVDGLFYYRLVIFENDNNTLIYEEPGRDNNANLIVNRFVFHKLN